MSDLAKVILCMKALGKTPKINNFQDRLVTQKFVCLLELMGFDLSYRFSLHVRGPYSPDLTTDLYANKNDFESQKTPGELSAREMTIITRISEESDDLDPIQLEIMATYSYLSKKCKMDAKDALIELKRLKPFYSETKIVVGVSRAKGLFPPSESEIRKMKSEFAELEGAAVSDNKH